MRARVRESLAGLRVGVVGAGEITNTCHLPVLAALGAETAWLIDPDRARLGRTQRAYRVAKGSAPDAFAEFLTRDPVDVVLLACPYGARAAYYQALSGSRCALLIEKPVAKDLDELDAILAARPWSRTGAAFVRRTLWALEALVQAIESQTFGALESIAFAFGNAARFSSGGGFARELALAGGGQLFESAIHFVDAALYAAGADSVRLDRVQMIHRDGFDLDTRARATLERDGRADVRLDLVVTAFEPTDNELVFGFEHAKVRLALFTASPPRVESRDGKALFDLAPAPGTARVETAFQYFAAAWLRFVDDLEHGREGPLHLARTRPTTALIGALYREGLK